MLWSIFTYIVTHHGLGGFSGLINGLITAAIGALSILTFEPTAKNKRKEDTYVCPLTLATLHYITCTSCMDFLLVEKLDSLFLRQGSFDLVVMLLVFSSFSNHAYERNGGSGDGNGQGSFALAQLIIKL